MIASRVLRASVAIVLLSLTARGVMAQTCQTSGPNATCSVNATTSITLPQLPVRLTVGSATTSFGTVTSADFDQGFALVNGPTVTVKANSAWSVQISSASTFWSGSGAEARADKPRADLRWANAIDPSGVAYAPVSATATQIGSGAGTAGTVVPLYFLSVWNYAVDTPGLYTISVTLTLVRP